VGKGAGDLAILGPARIFSLQLFVR
jgi:hypothetical protein